MSQPASSIYFHDHSQACGSFAVSTSKPIMPDFAQSMARLKPCDCHVCHCAGFVEPFSFQETPFTGSFVPGSHGKSVQLWREAKSKKEVATATVSGYTVFIASRS